MSLPTEAKARKAIPITTGVLDYFPNAIAEVARVSKAGNDQHNPGQPLHWAREKSTDHADCIARHLLERGTVDPLDGMKHSAKLAWRALALLEIELERDAIERDAQAEQAKIEADHNMYDEAAEFYGDESDDQCECSICTEQRKIINGYRVMEKQT